MRHCASAARHYRIFDSKLDEWEEALLDSTQGGFAAQGCAGDKYQLKAGENHHLRWYKNRDGFSICRRARRRSGAVWWL